MREKSKAHHHVCLELITQAQRSRARMNPLHSRCASKGRGEAGGFGCLDGKTNALPQMSYSHSLELVLARVTQEQPRSRVWV